MEITGLIGIKFPTTFVAILEALNTNKLGALINLLSHSVYERIREPAYFADDVHILERLFFERKSEIAGHILQLLCSRTIGVSISFPSS